MVGTVLFTHYSNASVRHLFNIVEGSVIGKSFKL